MEKYGKGNKSAGGSKPMQEEKGALEQKGSGSMNYTEVQEKFENSDGSKIKKMDPESIKRYQ